MGASIHFMDPVEKIVGSINSPRYERDRFLYLHWLERVHHDLEVSQNNVRFPRSRSPVDESDLTGEEHKERSNGYIIPRVNTPCLGL